MIWLALVVAVVIAVVTAAAVLGRVDGSLADATTTMSHVPLPDDPLTHGDLDALRFDTAMRGYRMSQVDAVIDRLRREIDDLDDELTRVRGSRPQTRTVERHQPDGHTGEDPGGYRRPVPPAEPPTGDDADPSTDQSTDASTDHRPA